MVSLLWIGPIRFKQSLQRPKLINNHKTIELPDAPWSQEVNSILHCLEVTNDAGLSAQQVASRQTQFGLNQLQKVKPKGLF